MSPSKPLIAVCGATGLQGGSVADFLLEDGGFRVRALTRHPEGTKAKYLASQGAEVVYADFDKPETLQTAFEGARGVFGMTSYFDPSAGPDGKNQVRQGKNIIEAAKGTGVQHFVLSTADHTGELRVPHWETQAEINDYLIESGLSRTSLYTTFYYENMFKAMPFTKMSDGSVKFSWPIPSDSRFAAYAVSDTGGFVLEILKAPAKYIGRDVKVASEFLTPRQWVKTMNAVSESKGSMSRVVLDEMDVSAFETIRGTVWDELWLNSKMLISNPAPPFRDPTESRAIYPKLKTLRAVTEEHWQDVLLAAQ